ncbi:hypothetical protein F4V73_10575 [Morganella psychrotolerans]|uniref:Uncharacterized protein n=1 Tax=Morganella psychrotolerans TaxID=368603 RepID=A0A5M9R6A9_9GAMM|nr:hypothetical protein F4V73_10575 [Morganella psychrotolerans]
MNTHSGTTRAQETDEVSARRLYDIIVTNGDRPENIYQAFSLMGLGDNNERNIQKKINLIITVEKKLANNPEYSYSEIRKSVSQVGCEVINYQAWFQQYLRNMVDKKQLGIAPNALSADYDHNNEDDWLTGFA